MPSSAVGSVGNDKGAVYCFLFIPPSVAWAAGLSRWGYPPLNPGRPPERAGESTRTPLISPEKLALPRPARGAPLASSLAGFFRETGGQWRPHSRTSPCAPVWPTASAYGFFASEKSKPWLFDSGGPLLYSSSMGKIVIKLAIAKAAIEYRVLFVAWATGLSRWGYPPP